MKFLKHLAMMMPKYIEKIDVQLGESIIYIKEEHLIPVLTFLKDHTGSQFHQCMDVTAVDYPERENRFDVIYQLLSIRYRARIQVIVQTSDPVESITSVYTSAGWPEREVFDLMGIFFKNHPDLRRLLTDYGFEGHPLRKDFPLTGFYELRYDDTEKRVVYEKLNLPQQLRTYKKSSPWNRYLWKNNKNNS